MSLYGAFDKTKHMSELADPLDTQEGVLSPAARRQLVIDNIFGTSGFTLAELQVLDGLTATTAELNILDGVTATAAELNMAADSSANTEIVTGANVITAAESGTTYILNAATGFASTLPVVAAGLRFTFIVGATAPSSGNHTIVPNAANDDTIYGEYLVAGATVPASAEGSINVIASTALPGDKIDVFCDGTNWYVSGAAAASGAVTFTT